MNEEFLISEDGGFGDAEGMRIDAFLAGQIADLSRSAVQRMIEAGDITVNKAAKKANYKLRAGDTIEVKYRPPQEIEVLPEDLPLDILYEDDDIIVVNKARGMVVHPAAGVNSGTLVNALLYHCRGGLSGINGKIRPGIVHRLDKDTSGVMVAAKNDFAHAGLAQQIGSKSAVKEYLALVHGRITEESGVINANIGRHPVDRKKMAVTPGSGKEAVTLFTVLERYKDCTYVQCRLMTGRTHQIRVHMAYIGHPLIGDPKYCAAKNKFSIKGQALHSYRLTLRHPRTGEEMVFTAPIPQDMQKLLNYFRQSV